MQLVQLNRAVRMNSLENWKSFSYLCSADTTETQETHGSLNVKVGLEQNY